jgi:hypothetical protein
VIPTISISTNSSAFIATLGKLQDGQRRAIAVALNDSAFKARSVNVPHALRVAFPSVTPYVERGVVVRGRATTQRLEVEVRIAEGGVDVAGVGAARVLRAQAQQTTRHAKRFEVTLQKLGYLPSGWVTVPAGGARLDERGNMSTGLIRELQSYFGAAELTSGYTANSTVKTRAAKKAGREGKRYGYVYFVGKPAGGRLPLGIYKRTRTGFGWALTPVVLFVPRAKYARRFDFQAATKDAIDQNFLSDYRRRFSEQPR